MQVSDSDGMLRLVPDLSFHLFIADVDPSRDPPEVRKKRAEDRNKSLKNDLLKIWGWSITGVQVRHQLKVSNYRGDDSVEAW